MRRRLRQGLATRIVWLVGLLALAAPQDALGSPVDMFGFGARSGAMAGAVTSSAKGFSAVYHNPAALVLEEGPSFALGYQHALFFLDINGQKHEALGAPATIIGLSVPLPFGGWLEDRVAIGMGFVLPLTSVLIADIPRPDTPRFSVVENRAQTISLMAAVSVRIIDELTIGAGVIALSALSGAIDVAPRLSGSVGADVRDELIADFSAITGVMSQPVSWLSIGATFRDVSRADFVLPIEVDLGDSFNLPVPRLDVRGTAQYDPRQLSVGVSVMPTEPLTVSTDVVWKAWSAYENPIVYTAVPDRYPLQPSAKFEDTYSVRVGAEYVFALDDWTLSPRAGLAYEPTPAPEAVGLHNYLDSDRVISAMGLGVRWKMLTLDVAFQWQAMVDRRHDKDPVLIAEEQVAPAEENAGYPSIEHGGDLIFWQLELGAAF